MSSQQHPDQVSSGDDAPYDQYERLEEDMNVEAEAEEEEQPPSQNAEEEEAGEEGSAREEQSEQEQELGSVPVEEVEQLA